MTLSAILRVRPSRFRILLSMVLLVAIVLVTPSWTAAQSGPPVKKTVALESTTNVFYRAVHVIIVATMDAYRLAKDFIVGGKGADALEGLREGSAIVLQYGVEGADPTVREIGHLDEEGLWVTEGTVTRITDGRKRIAVRFAAGATETFELIERAAPGTAKDLGQPVAGETKVLIYYSDEAGRKIAHVFRKIS
jgi:hypothetical protein